MAGVAGAESTAVRAGATFEETFEALDRELGRAPAALLAITGASNVTGECPPLARLAELAHRHGARLAVDGAQLAPHRRVEIEATGIDYLAISGHKLYAPYGGGALIGRRDWLDAAEPHLPGGGAVVNVTLEGAQWKPSPARHEGGTPNLVGAVALAAGLEALHELGYERIAAHETELYGRLEQGLRALGISVLRIWPERHDLVAVASFTVPGHRADLVAAYLSAEHGIGVRGGRFCAHPLLERLGLADDGAVRVSIGLGTSGEDVDALLDRAGAAHLLRARLDVRHRRVRRAGAEPRSAALDGRRGARRALRVRRLTARRVWQQVLERERRVEEAPGRHPTRGHSSNGRSQASSRSLPSGSER